MLRLKLLMSFDSPVDSFKISGTQKRALQLYVILALFSKLSYLGKRSRHTPYHHHLHLLCKHLLYRQNYCPIGYSSVQRDNYRKHLLGCRHRSLSGQDYMQIHNCPKKWKIKQSDCF